MSHLLDRPRLVTEGKLGFAAAGGGVAGLLLFT